MTTDYYGNSALSMGSTINDKNDNSFACCIYDVYPVVIKGGNWSFPLEI